MTKKLLSIVFFVIMFSATNGVAATQYWVVNKIAGQAILTKANKEPQWVMLNDRVGPGDKIATLKNGTVALVRNAEAMIISSDSEIEIPTNGNDSQLTMIFQKLGTVLFSAKKKSKKHFQIRTPYAAAIVKGTTFAINANSYNTQVQVFEGLVSVRGRGRSRTYNVGAGKKSLIPAEKTQKVIINSVASASNIHLHFGSDIDQLSLNYLNKIEIGGGGSNEFNHDVISEITTGGSATTTTSGQNKTNDDTSKPTTNNKSNLDTENSVSIAAPIITDEANSGLDEPISGGNAENTDNSATGNGKEKSNNSANGESSSANSGNGNGADKDKKDKKK